MSYCLDHDKRISCPKCRDGGPAFPLECNAQIAHGMAGEHAAFITRHLQEHQGMSLRDYFAAKALTGILAAAAEKYIDSYGTTGAHERVAGDAYFLADAMLAARNKEEE